ncbi:MAG TPA: molybdenum cofactor guanylyltransferase, partial [Firmicutes bacterium]|nr:molybdenum cofactor guanylyltransferase [Bacillota bacterium]
MKFDSAVILAGGRSTRMGFDKQLLRHQELTIVEHQIGEIAACFSDIMVASPTPALYEQRKVRVIEDIHTGIGPLGGIHAALKQAKSEAVFVIACDMPYLEIAYIEYMIKQLHRIFCPPR